MLTDSVLSAALSWFSTAVSSVLKKMGASAANPAQWLTVGPAGAGAMLEGSLGGGREEGEGRGHEMV